MGPQIYTNFFWQAILIPFMVFLRSPNQFGQVSAAPNIIPSTTTYNAVILGGRVMDPESGLDMIANIGISEGVIRIIDVEPIIGHEVIEASGLIVAPGFIDVVWNIPPSYSEVQLLDGVTTSLELWIGTDDVERWYAEREGKMLTNYGVSVGHERIRRRVMQDPGLPGSPGDAMNRAANNYEIKEISSAIDQGLTEGALAVSMTNVTPAASGLERLQMFRAAQKAGAPVWTPPRETGDWLIDDMPMYFSELIGMASITGAALSIVHIQASGGPYLPELLKMLAEARTNGLDVIAEVNPYTSNLSHINFIDSDNWQSWPDEWFTDMEWLATGEQLTRRSYEQYRKQEGQVIIHNREMEQMVTQAVVNDHTMIVSGAYLNDQGRGHPRASGTHARVLGRYVRDQKQLSVMKALEKMSLMMAQRLERRAPALTKKGRISVGADADIVVFNPNQIIDRSTFQRPTEKSRGVQYLLINGVVVVADGHVQKNVYSGKSIRARSVDW